MNGRRARRTATSLAVPVMVLALAVVTPGAALADHPQARPDVSLMDYTPLGGWEPGMPIPSPLEPPTDPNPSGKWVAYDTNLYETLNFPMRQAGDTTDDDPPGSGDPRHGFCPPSPESPVFGRCDNHQLEYLDHYAAAMREILGDFGVVIHRYEFEVPDDGLPTGTYLGTQHGRGINIAATVPGADHPDERVLVSGHYDFTDSGPAAAWDSAEGHAEVIRMAAIMADYWRQTGTRPSATMTFVPWDAEEVGTIGSADYAANNIPPGEEAKVRGYFNVDPCAGAYPAFRNGNPTSRVPEVMQLANPAPWEDEPEIHARIEAFNARAETVVDEVFDHLDDTLTTGGTEYPIFVSDAEGEETGEDSQRDEIVTAVGGLALFTSDYRNFEELGIPIFNLFPDYFGPHADGEPASAEGLGILHTPRDNLTTINALTSTDQSGMTVSEGWAKGMEMCAQIESWYMLQPQMAGAQDVTADVVAYYEALPNEAIVSQDAVRFDATGSYRYLDPSARSFADGAQLTYAWDFGDGTSGTGRIVEHTYREVGVFPSTLTVTDRATGATGTMAVPITVIPSDLQPPVLDDLPDEDGDGTFELTWTYAGSTEGFEHYAVEESTDARVLLADDAEGDLDALWEANEPGDGQTHPWQPSDGSPALYGNKAHEGRSYWTGVNPPAPSPLNVSSTLTLREPLRVPLTGDTQLTFWSYYESESDDAGLVEVAPVAAGETGEWIEVLREEGTILDEGKGPAAPLVNRTVSLARFAGKDVLVRFNYRQGGSDPAVSQPVGWYVDDIAVVAGSWSSIGETAEPAFQVTDRPNGTYGYRVRAVFADDVSSGASNPEVVTVTDSDARAPRQPPPAPPPGPPAAPPPRPPLPTTGGGVLPLALTLLVAGLVLGRRRSLSTGRRE